MGDRESLKASKSRITLTSRHTLEGVRNAAVGTDGAIEVRVSRLWPVTVALSVVLVALMIAVCVVARLPALITSAAVVTTALLIGALMHYADGGEHWTRGWRFGAEGATRRMRLPLPARLWPRRFPDVHEFEIVHTIWTEGFFGPSRIGDGYEDTLRFRSSAVAHPITVMTIVTRDSFARPRGENFTQARANEVEREISPDVLAIGAAAAEVMRVPLYASERTVWVGSGTDG